MVQVEEEVFQHTLHKELWQWLADNPDKEKNEWPRWSSNGGDIGYVTARCFACNYNSDCVDCPLVWPDYPDNEGDICGKDGSLFDRWLFTTGSSEGDKRSRLAEQIRDLPVKEGVLTE